MGLSCRLKAKNTVNEAKLYISADGSNCITVNNTAINQVELLCIKFCPSDVHHLRFTASSIVIYFFLEVIACSFTEERWVQNIRMTRSTLHATGLSGPRQLVNTH